MHILYVYIYIKLAYYFLFFINIFAEIFRLRSSMNLFLPRLFKNYNYLILLQFIEKNRKKKTYYPLE